MSASIWTPPPKTPISLLPAAGPLELRIGLDGETPETRTLQYWTEWPDEHSIASLARVQRVPARVMRRRAKESVREGRIWVENLPGPDADRRTFYVGLKVIAALERTPHGELLHVSCSYETKDPSWAEIRAIRDAIFPLDRDAMMMLPAEGDYVNVHRHTFHLWQTPAGWGIR